MTRSRPVSPGSNTALAKAPGSIGATAGYAIGHATGIPGAAEVGGAAGYALGKELLPQVQIPGAGVGLPNRVTGGPATAPQYVPPRIAPAAPASISSRTSSLADLRGVLDQTFGVTPLQKNVPLRQQQSVIGTTGNAIPTQRPTGFTPVESDAVEGYSYDPQAREFHVKYKSSPTVYAYGDVSAEDVQDFENAESKGSEGMQQIRTNPLVKKNGRPVKPVSRAPQESGLNEGGELTGQVTQTFPRR